jgi:hypothetical protein
MPSHTGRYARAASDRDVQRPIRTSLTVCALRADAYQYVQAQSLVRRSRLPGVNTCSSEEMHGVHRTEAEERNFHRRNIFENQLESVHNLFRCLRRPSSVI